MADQAFSTYTFPVTGGTTSRTLHARLAEIHNVKDFGAVGDGVTDDLAAITAAFNWTAGANRGMLYFPPGTYYVSGPIDISSLNTFVAIFGHMGLSTIVGNFADFVIKRYIPSSQIAAGGHNVECLTVINQHADGGGIRMGGCLGASIRDCDITANVCLDTDNTDLVGAGVGEGIAYWGSLEQIIQNCNCRPYNIRASKSTGVSTSANGQIKNCTFKDFDTGIRAFGIQGDSVIQGCYFETCNVGLANGLGPNQTSWGLGGGSGGGSTIAGCYFKNNGIAIAHNSAANRYLGVRIEAAEGTIPGNPQYGIYIPAAGETTFSVFDGISVVGQYQVAGIYIVGGEQRIAPSFWAGVSSINTSTLGGVAWVRPTTAMTADFMGVNVAPVFTMAQLPAGLSDVTAATWSGGRATLSINPPHQLQGTGDGTGGANFTVSGVTPSGYNGTFDGVAADVRIDSFNTMSYLVADPGGSGTVFGTVFYTGTSGYAFFPLANVYESYCFNVSDANTATWGAAVTAGGGSNHCKVRYTPAGWTVVGK